MLLNNRKQGEYWLQMFTTRYNILQQCGVKDIIKLKEYSNTSYRDLPASIKEKLQLLHTKEY